MVYKEHIRHHCKLKLLMFHKSCGSAATGLGGGCTTTEVGGGRDLVAGSYLGSVKKICHGKGKEWKHGK